ncbi:hypothetical protein O181_113037 [Austropuccinia psidii MF-1]|uniref:Uncharacterized protein n=1 Tax=Austropuccinia psidii MF-1 TaxID=1389203 RepID=A0A9Q3PUY5_9BASI|nr:hypothetical protein [Austropuccinia psidii MF-1]
MGGRGLNGLFGPFRPPTAPTARGPWSVGQLGPFWPNPMRPKWAKGGSYLAPQARWVPKPPLDPPEPKLVTNPLDPKLAKDLLDTNLAINPVGPIFGHGLWKPPEATRSAQSAFPSTYGEFFPFLHAIRT